MTHDDPPVRLILDRSALLAYVAGSMHAAETLHEVILDGVRFGVPAVVVAEALAVVDDYHDRMILRRLLDSEACAVLDTYGDSWDELSYCRQLTGRLDAAAAVLAGFDHQAPVLTGEAKLYGDVVVAIELPD